MSAVTLSNVTKSYGALQVVHGVDLEIARGECVVLVGPEGSGKLAVLRMVAGTESPSGGRITIGPRDVTREPPARRRVELVTPDGASRQGSRLARWLSLRPKRAEPCAAERQRLGLAARSLRVEGLLDRRAAEISEADRVRVAIARAIARAPDLLVLDDPLAALDAAARADLRDGIARLRAEFGVTILWATEDPTEAMALADRIVVLREGRIAQTGPPQELRRDPDNLFVAGFLGHPAMNFLAAVAVEGALDVAALGRRIAVAERLRGEGMAVTLGFGPADAVLETGDGFQVERTEECGGVPFARLRAATDERLLAAVHGRVPARPGDRVGLGLDPARLLLFDAETGLRMR